MFKRKKLFLFLFLGIGFCILFFSFEVKAAAPGDVIINEIMWMGSTATDTDEWIELRNASDTAIDLIDWTIEDIVHGATTTLTLNASICSTTTIPAGSYFLIGNATSGYSRIADSITIQCATDTIDLIDDYSLNCQIALKEGINVIDRTPSWAAVWAGGATGTATSSMARNYTPGEGSATSSWHTSIIATNWDPDSPEKGTPGSYNGYSVSGQLIQLNGNASGTIYVIPREHGTTTATATASFTNLGNYQMHLFQALYDFFAFRDSNATPTQYNDGSEPRQSLNNYGDGYNLTSAGTSSLNFVMAVNPTISSNTPSTISIGETMTITGTYFGDSTTTAQGTVTIVPVNVSPLLIDVTNQVTFWSSTSIQVVIPPATTPPGPQTGQLLVQIGWTPFAGISLIIQPTVTSAVATDKYVSVNFDSYIDGGPATNPTNYTLQSPIGGTTVPLTTAWAEFRGHKVYIKNLSLTVGKTFSITAGSNIKSIAGTAIKTASSTATGTVVAAPVINSLSPSSGNVGDTVTISGSNFGSATGTLYFPAGPPTVGPPPSPIEATGTNMVSWSNTSIVIKIPSGVQTCPIFVVTAAGIESEFTENAVFNVLTNLKFNILEKNTGTTISSTTARIVIGGPGGPKLYFVGDTYNTSDDGTGTTTIPDATSVGFNWAFDSSGAHFTSRGQQVAPATTTVFYLATSTTAVSGTITGAGDNRLIVIWSNPIEGTGEAMEWGEPIFAKTDVSGNATYNLGLSATGTYIIGVEDPGFTTTSNPKIAPSPQEVNASTSATSTVNFTFQAASARIHGKIEKAGGVGPPIDTFHVWGYQPIENGLHASAMPDSSGEFDLYVNPGVYIIGVGGPDMPFPVEKQIEVKEGDPNFALTNAITDITLIIKAPEEYIAGKVTDSNGNAISGVSIFAWNQFGPGGQAFTDSSGCYKMYISPGTNYTVEGFSPQYGKLTSRSGVQVSQGCDDTQTCPTVDFAVSSEMTTISGTVVKNNASSSDMDVWVTQGETGYGINGTRTGTDGTFTLRVPYTPSGVTYWLHVGKPGRGELFKAALPTFDANLTSYSTTTQINTANIYVRISPGTAFDKAFVEARYSNYRGFSDKNISATTTYKEYLIEIPKPSAGAWTYNIFGGIPNYGPLTPTTTNATSGSATILVSVSLGNIWTVSGSIADPDATTTGNQSEGAFVWAGGASGHGGGKVDASGNFSFNLKEGTYDFGIDKPGYIGSLIPNQTINSNTILTGLTLTLANRTISGTVYKGGTAESGAWVWATNGSGGWAGAQTDGQGNFSLSVTAGDWSVRAASEGYESGFTGTVPAGTSGLTINLNSISGYSATAPVVEPIVPKTGGIVQGEKVKIEAPSGALDSQDSNTGSITIKKTTSVPSTNEAKPLGGYGQEITVTKSDGTPITVLYTDPITITLTYSASDLSAAGVTQAQAANLSLGYFDSTTNKWTSIPTAVSTSTDGSVTYTGTTKHLSPFAPLVSSGANPPPTPTGLTASPGNQYITLSWNTSAGATKYNIYRRSDSLYPYLAQTTNTTYSDGGLVNGATYYYKISALNADNDESTSTEPVSGTPTTVGAPAGPGGAALPTDVTPPSISQVTVTVGETKATISWKTDESSISWLFYGTTTNYGLEIKTTTSTTSHSLTLTGLSASTTYHYQIKSKDSAGNVGSYTDQTFTTLAPGAVPEEIVEKPPVVTKPIAEMTVEELKTEITRITALILQLQAELAKMVGKVVYEGIPAGFTFEKNLSPGISDPDVVYLKIVLATEGCVSGLKNTEYFASQTLAGVKCFQKKYKDEISQFAGYPIQASGFVGEGTRAKLNQLISR